MAESDEDDFELYSTRYYIEKKEKSSEDSYIYDDGLGRIYEKLVGRDKLRTEDDFSDEYEDSFDKSDADQVSDDDSVCYTSDQLVTKRDYAIKEILDTERRYCNQLLAIIDQFLKEDFNL